MERQAWSLTDRCREESKSIFERQGASQKEGHLLQSAEIQEMAEPAKVILWKEIMPDQVRRYEQKTPKSIDSTPVTYIGPIPGQMVKLSEAEFKVLTLFAVHLIRCISTVGSFITLQIGINAATILASEEGGVTVPIAYCIRNSSDS